VDAPTGTDLVTWRTKGLSLPHRPRPRSCGAFGLAALVALGQGAHCSPSQGFEIIDEFAIGQALTATPCLGRALHVAG
jgi:hypothetical protein